MNTYKCLHCTRQNHTFKDCTKVTCSCACVRELFSLPKNEDHDDISKAIPKFFHIKCDEIAGLLYPYKQMNEFMKVRTKEQVIGKPVDRRLKETY